MSPGAFGADDVDVAPAVIDAEHFGSPHEDDQEFEAEDELPLDDMAVLIPTADVVDEGSGQAHVQLRQTGSGALALPVYTSQESFVDCCGENQPWVAVRVRNVQEIAAQAGADVVVRDAALPSEPVDPRRY
ncbi:SAV_915 family protein [Saccharopolyspora rosea]|uniref:SAV_915 family protein n=1 Tax=Saccharopolyspora rosea TaxID=524884 RepID=UPI0021D7D671|nr:SAV_915 family protein [Saccharopolyspora rosea]